MQKLFDILLITTALVVVLSNLEIDLTSLAWMTGAIGLGIGFGLQKLFANFISGFIILADKSIKPGDVIQMEDTYGWINYLVKLTLRALFQRDPFLVKDKSVTETISYLPDRALLGKDNSGAFYL